MTKLRIDDIGIIQRAPASPASLRVRLGNLLMSSLRARATVEFVDRRTGEYRVVFQGTLETAETHADETRHCLAAGDRGAP